MRNILMICILLTMGLVACQDEDNNRAEVINPETGDPAIDAVSAEIEKDSANAELYAQRGSLYYERQVHREALRDFNQAILLDSTQVGYYHTLADIYLDNNDSYTALEVLKDAKRRFPDDIPTILKLADFQLITQQYMDGMKNVNQTISKDPQNAEAYYLRGMYYREMRTPGKAMESFQKAVELNSELTDAYLIMGDMMSRENEELALRFYENAELNAPENEYVLHSKALHLHQMGRLDEAMEVYKKIHRLNPRYADAFYNGALLYLEIDSVQKAQNLLNIAIANDALYAKSYYYRGETYRMQGKREKAIADYEKALEISPNLSEAQKQLNALKKKEAVQ